MGNENEIVLKACIEGKLVYKDDKADEGERFCYFNDILFLKSSIFSGIL